MRLQIALLALAVLVAGCKKGPTVATLPVTGKITIGGKPLEGANVVFTNKNPDQLSAGGTTDSQGEFKLSTWVGPKEIHAGAVSGEYIVTITKAPPGAPQEDMSKMEHASPEERSELMMKKMQGAMEAKKGPQPKSEVPARYSSPESTPLKPTVMVGEKNHFDWPLEEK